MVESFSRALVAKILDFSADHGLCARCGREVLKSGGVVEGDVFSDLIDDTTFYYYECKVCLGSDVDRFFKNNWFDAYLCRRR